MIFSDSLLRFFAVYVITFGTNFYFFYRTIPELHKNTIFISDITYMVFICSIKIFDKVSNMGDKISTFGVDLHLLGLLLISKKNSYFLKTLS